MRVLVLGCRGMLGHQLFATLRKRHDVMGTVRGEHGGEGIVTTIDAREFASVERALRATRPEVIVNCIGVVKQRPATAADYAAVNALFPHLVEAAASRIGARFIHISTDCVFSGAKGRYTEDDLPDATDTYGISKRLGEPSSDRTLTIRTSFIGRELAHRTGLLEWFLRQRTCHGFTHFWFSGVTTVHLARLIEKVIEEHADLSGIHHVAGPRMSKYELLCAMKEALALPTEIIPDDRVCCDKTLSGDGFDAAIGRTRPSLADLAMDLADLGKAAA